MLRYRAVGMLVVVALLLWGGVGLYSQDLVQPALDLLENEAEATIPKASDGNWRSAAENLQAVLELPLPRPAYYVLAGKLVLEQSRKSMKLGERDYESTQGFYRAAIRARPAWPYVWANLALLEFRARPSRSSPQLSHALVQALIFGPSERNILRFLLRNSMPVWPGLPSDVQDVVGNVAKRVEIVLPDYVETVLKQPGNAAQLCGNVQLAACPSPTGH